MRPLSYAWSCNAREDSVRVHPGGVIIIILADLFPQGAGSAPVLAFLPGPPSSRTGPVVLDTGGRDPYHSRTSHN